LLTVLIATLTLPSFKTESITISKAPISGQVCETLIPYTGSPLGVAQQVAPALDANNQPDYSKPAIRRNINQIPLTLGLNDEDLYTWFACFMTNNVVANSTKTTEYTGNEGTTVPAYGNSYQQKWWAKCPCSATFCKAYTCDNQQPPSCTGAHNPALLFKLVKTYSPRRTGVFFSDVYTAYSGFLDDPWNSRNYLFVQNQYTNVYYKDFDTCMSNMNLVSAELKPGAVAFMSVYSSIYHTPATLPGQIFVQQGADPSSGTNVYPFYQSYVDFKFSDPGFSLTFGPALSNSFRYSNLICKQAYEDPVNGARALAIDGVAEYCGPGGYTQPTESQPGIQTNPFSDYSEQDTMNLFNSLFPNWKSEACSVFRNLPPYQCKDVKSPSFVTAAGSSLAFFNSLVGLLFILGAYLLTNGYDVTASLSCLGKASPPASDWKVDTTIDEDSKSVKSVTTGASLKTENVNWKVDKTVDDDCNSVETHNPL